MGRTACKQGAIKLIKRGFRGAFVFCQRLGLNVTPRHYESPIPYIHGLSEEVWKRRSEMIGVDLRAQEQVDMVRGFADIYRSEFNEFPVQDPGIPGQYYVNNRYFESVDGEVLYCFVRHFKPKTVIEIGGGNSTLLFAQAMNKNKEEDPGYNGELTVIDPHPRQDIRDSISHLGTFMKMRVQDVSLEEFEVLGPDDILFIDSSHVLRIGSDVQYEILEIIPRLKQGAIIHFHDIFLPADYPRSWVIDNLRFLNEQYVLQAFLTFNRQFEVLFAASYMHLNHPAVLEEAFNTYRRDRAWPGSLWLRRKADPWREPLKP